MGGVAILSQYAATYCGDDAVELESDTFDNCSGHADPMNKAYHYHLSPACLLDQIGDYDGTTTHSPMIGWALDGFPVHGPHGNNGDDIYLCTHSSANSSDCLDECNGHSQHEIDGFLYHYHISGPIGDLGTNPLSPIPDTTMAPYTIGCFKGVVFDWNSFNGADNGASCLSDGYSVDYEPMPVDGITTPYDPNANVVTSSPTTLRPSDNPTINPTTSAPTPLPSRSPLEIGETFSPTEGPTGYPTVVPTVVPTENDQTETPTMITTEYIDPNVTDESESSSKYVTVYILCTIVLSLFF